jgi:hypothetical protein
MKDERGNWYLLTGLILGIALGLVIAWVVAPVEFIDVTPSSMRDDYKDYYRAIVASAYSITGDLERAQARLGLLADADIPITLAAQAQRYLGEGRSATEAQALALLASALGQGPTPAPVSSNITSTRETESKPTDSPTPKPTKTETLKPTLTTTSLSATVTPTATQVITPTATGLQRPTRTPRPSRTPTPTHTPLPSRTPTPTLGAPYVLDNQVPVCNPNLGESQIQVFITDSAGVEVPGVEIIINWDGQGESFFTGLKPDIGPGYADFTILPGVVYSLHVADGGEIISDLSAEECSEGSQTRYWGSWRLTFKQP